jgi:hypothetical protein
VCFPIVALISTKEYHDWRVHEKTARVLRSASRASPHNLAAHVPGERQIWPMGVVATLGAD